MAKLFWKTGRVDKTASQIGQDGPGVTVFEKGSKHRDKWVAVVEADESADGKKHWITVPVPAEKKTAKGRKAAEAWLANHLNEQLRYRAAGAQVAEKMMVKELVAEYLTANHLGEKSREYGILQQFQAFKVGNSVIGNMLLTSVTSGDIQKYLHSTYTRRIETPQADGSIVTTVRKYGHGNAARHRIAVHALFASAEDHVPPLIQKGMNPVDAAPNPAEQYDDSRTREMKPEEEARMALFLDNATRYPGLARLKRFIQFALFSLARRDEIFNVRWRDIDLTDRILEDGNRSFGVIKFMSVGEQQTKSREHRPVEVYPMLRAMLLEMRAEALKEVGSLDLKAIEDRFVFVNRDGKQYKSIRGAWLTLMKKSGVSDLHVHDLRRTGAIRYRRLGVDIEILQSMLGHADVETTMRYLGDVGKEQARGLNRAWARQQELAQVAQTGTDQKAAQ